MKKKKIKELKELKQLLLSMPYFVKYYSHRDKWISAIDNTITKLEKDKK